MEKKVFTSKLFIDTIYKVLNEFWLDNDTYVLVFQDMTDKDDDVYHLEVEYHKDKNEITYTRVYEHENIDASLFVSHGFKVQFEEYIFQQIGMLRKDSMLVKRNINVQLTLDVPQDLSIGEFQQWLSDLVVEVKSPQADKVRVLGIENKGNVTK